MLKIRPEQLEALAEGEREEFIRRGAATLREHAGRFLPKNGPAPAELMREAIDRAGRYAITDQQSVMRWAVLMLLLGREFDIDPRFPWAASTLAQKGLLGSVKMQLLYDDAAGLLGRSVEEIVG